jgi:hypothetical protein
VEVNFFINIPIGLIAIFLSIKLLEESRFSIRKSFDNWGVLLLSIGLFGMTYTLTVSEKEIFSARNLLLITISVGILVYFIKNQKNKLKNKKPYLIDFGLFRYKNFYLGIMAVFSFLLCWILFLYSLFIFSGWINN